MSLIDRLLAGFAPHNCLACGLEAGLLCSSCLQSLQPALERCYRCNNFSEAFKTCLDCLANTPLLAARSAAAYGGVAKDLVRHVKFSGVQIAAKIMAQRMIAMNTNFLKNSEFVVVPVPTATSRVRQRGYDQAKLLAKELAWQAKLPYLDCLVRMGQAHQVGASRAERLRQLESALRVKKPRTVRNRHILLIDDVLTTGASVSAAAIVLRSAGATRIEALTFAQA
ncbi:MAG TPA: phosphoribosyltransferase family protein [Candidatus Saccharimonadales bacterium]